MTDQARQLAASAVAITEARGYVGPAGRSIDLRDAIDRAIARTRWYAPEDDVREPAPRFAATHITVVNDTTLAAARRLVARGHEVAALNFASARNPGGGFLKGALAQEESLCRASALHACLADGPMYAYHRDHPDPVYAHWVGHSPGVPVFRDDDGPLLDEPYRVTFLTSPAPNARVALDRDPTREGSVVTAMRERIDRVLAVAALHGHDALVLGAWGCGVFGNRPRVVADQFAAALRARFRGQFAEVVFAILDPGPGAMIEPFARTFGVTQA